MDEQFMFSDSATMATVYKSNEGKYIIRPAVGLKGLLVSTKADVDIILKSGIPIEEDKPNPFQANKDIIEDIDSNKDGLFDMMKRELDIQSELNFDAVFIDNISKALNKKKQNDLYAKVFFPLGVYLGEYLRVTKGGKWFLQKRFGYNPYFVPVLVCNDGYTYDPWYKLADFLLKKSNKDLNKQLELVLASKTLKYKQ